MTITLEISSEAEVQLRRQASDAGVPFSEYLSDIVEGAARSSTKASRQLPQEAIEHPEEFDNLAFLSEIGVLGSVAGKPRSDGKSWSEIEAACDPH